MEEEKKYTKVKIFLFLIFTIFAIILISTVISIVRDLFNGISDKNYEFKCTSMKYSIDEKKISYDGKKLIFEINNKDYDLNISRITLFSASGQSALTPAKEITGGNSNFVEFSNITLEDKRFGIRLNDCTDIKNFTIRD